MIRVVKYLEPHGRVRLSRLCQTTCRQMYYNQQRRATSQTKNDTATAVGAYIAKRGALELDGHQILPVPKGKTLSRRKTFLDINSMDVHFVRD